MKEAIVVKWQRFNWIDTGEIMDLTRSLGYEVLEEITFRGEKPHPKHFIPYEKLQQILEYQSSKEDLTIIVDGDIRPYQLVELESLTGFTVIDKVMLVLEIFKEKASSKDIQLQIELANLQYSAPKMQTEISQNVESDRQARDRGSGEQIKDIAKSNINHRIAKIRQQLQEIQKKRTQSQEDDKILKIPVIGFYSAGKSTLFNILTESSQEVDAAAFTTMFTKIQRSEVLGYPLDLIDTVGLVDLPDNVLNAFNLMLEPIFSSRIIMVVFDSGLLRDQFLHQLSHVQEVVNRFSEFFDEYAKFLIVHSKTDLAEPAEIKARQKIIASQDWIRSYREFSTRHDQPEQVIADFKEHFELLNFTDMEHYTLESVSPALLSKLYDFSRVEEQEWNSDGTCTVSGVTYASLYGMIQKELANLEDEKHD